MIRSEDDDRLVRPDRSDAPPMVAIWYFVAATFIFAAPVVLLPDAALWMRIVSLVVGLLVLVAGAIQLGRELTHRRGRRPGGGEPPG